MTHTPYSSLVFSFPVDWDFLMRMWQNDLYRGYDNRSILENELYDFLYRD
jgi:hypothetical protein